MRVGSSRGEHPKSFPSLIAMSPSDLAQGMRVTGNEAVKHTPEGLSGDEALRRPTARCDASITIAHYMTYCSQYAAVWSMIYRVGEAELFVSRKFLGLFSY